MRLATSAPGNGTRASYDAHLDVGQRVMASIAAVASGPDNLKLTVAGDFAVAEALLSR